MAKYGSVSDAGKKVKTEKGKYDIYPTFPIEEGKLFEGFTSLAKAIADEKVIVIDGYIGKFFDDFKKRLEDEFARIGKKVVWISVDQALKEEAEISRIKKPVLYFMEDNSSPLTKPQTRFTYVSGEKNLNSANYAAVSAKDTYTTKIFRMWTKMI
jgi:hypothetical protein